MEFFHLAMHRLHFHNNLMDSPLILKCFGLALIVFLYLFFGKLKTFFVDWLKSEKSNPGTFKMFSVRIKSEEKMVITNTEDVEKRR